MAPELLRGWGGTAPSAAQVTAPADGAQVQAVLAAAPRRGVIARGLGRSSGDAAQNAGGTVIATTHLDGHMWVDRDAGELRVAAGASLDVLLRTLVPEGWFVPVTPGTRHVTIGGAIAADIHGKNHHRDGSFMRHVSSLTLATPAGVTTVTPTSDPDLFWATAGGLGLTGVVLDATVRLIPVRTSSVRVVTERAADLDDLMARMDARDHDHRYSVAWVDALAGGARLGRGVITWGDHADPGDVARRARDPLAFDPRTRLRVPGLPVPNVLTASTVAAFNEVWFRRAPSSTAVTVEPLSRFFHPLDGVGGWNRLYGPRGFLQYQFVVPFGAERVVRSALERLAALRCPSFLAILKRMGDGTPGPLSFPLPGWTLALDIPAGVAHLSEALDALDDEVAAAGGRVYLAKDSRLRPELVPTMYPRLAEWQDVCRRVDPHRALTSDLARRLRLVA